MTRGMPTVGVMSLVSAAVLACGCATAQSHPGAGLPSGTYEFRICRGHCDPTSDSAFATGSIVIMANPFSVDTIPDPARSYVRFYEEGLLVGFAEGEPNACFVVRRRGVGTYVGSSPVALTRWNSSRVAGTFNLALYQSPDAGYWLRLRAHGHDIEGTGYSFGPTRDTPRPPEDTVYLRATGPPDLGICTSAAALEARRHPPPGP